jgi:hypothetical protein
MDSFRAWLVCTRKGKHAAQIDIKRRRKAKHAAWLAPVSIKHARGRGSESSQKRVGGDGLAATHVPIDTTREKRHEAADEGSNKISLSEGILCCLSESSALA